MKQTRTLPLLAWALAATLLSCNNNSTEKTADSTAKTTDTATVAAAPAAAAVAAPAPAFKPFDVMEVRHRVKDYAKWRPAFNLDSVNRQANGMKDIVVGRNLSDPNDVMVALEVSDVAKAKSSATDARLKEVMTKAGVTGKPSFDIFHVIRFNPESKEKKWVVVTHKVKDFDAWLKVFDNEGTAARASEGLADVLIARDVNDANNVQLVFDIKDMEKAKAAVNSDAKKKLMESAGVIGKPTVAFFETADK